MFEDNKGTDQTGHLHSLISTFLIRLLENIINDLASREISIFLLVSVAEQAGLNFALREILEICFLSQCPNWKTSSKCNSSKNKNNNG